MKSMKEMPTETELNLHLKSLAFQYENKEFLVGDPSWFMHQIEGGTNKELLAFIASALSYGSRKQFLPKIQMLLDSITNYADGDVRKWLTRHIYERTVPATPECFYRLYTCQTFNNFLNALAEMVQMHGTIKDYIQAYIHNDISICQKALNQTPRAANEPTNKTTTIKAIEAITTWFREHGSTGVIPKDTTSSCKRICMFLRWMVRDNSPVDLGLWNDIIDKRTLIIPMDTHVVQEAMRLGLLKSKSTSMSNAMKLSNRLRNIFPEDPLKGDFALFGVGVDTDQG